jgi:glycosyltransferase involved in cell wall biosynthesis
MESTIMSFSPRIILPGFFIRTGKVGGAENAFNNLAYGLAKAGGIVDLFFFHKNQVSEEFLSLIARESGLRVHFTGREQSRFIAEQMFILGSKLQADAIIFPNYHTPIFIPKSLGKVVSIIHDCQYLHHPQNFPLRKKLWLRLAHKITLARADTVITLSSSAKEDIQKYSNGHSKNVSVIGNPVSWERFIETSDWKPPFEKYILSVAHPYPHKNLDTLIKAFSIVSKKRPEIGLILGGQVLNNLAGKISGGKDNGKLIDSLGLRDKIAITGFVDDQKLGVLYRKALFFAFPSLFEGFGLPPVEAMGLGTTTLTTRCASLPEVTLNMAQYVNDPRSPDEWANKMLAILDNSEKYRVLPAVEKRIREAYDLEKIGKKYLELICN